MPSLERHNGHAPSGLLTLGTMGIQVLVLADGTDGSRCDMRCRDASSTQLQGIGGKQVHRPFLWSVRDEELLPGGEALLERPDGTCVEFIATGTNGRTQHRVYLRWRRGKAALDDGERMLDNAMIGAHTTGMDHGHHGRLEGVEYYRQTVSDQHAQRHSGQAGHQRIG